MESFLRCLEYDISLKALLHQIKYVFLFKCIFIDVKLQNDVLLCKIMLKKPRVINLAKTYIVICVHCASYKSINTIFIVRKMRHWPGSSPWQERHHTHTFLNRHIVYLNCAYILRDPEEQH